MSLRQAMTVLMNFQELQGIVYANRLQDMQGRFPRHDRDYKWYVQQVRAQGIHPTTNLLVNELHWAPSSALYDSPEAILDTYVKPFCKEDDTLFTNSFTHKHIKIMRNRFPYDFTKDLTHLVVFTKFPIPSDPQSVIGDISSVTKQAIESFLCHVFVELHGINRSDFVWFKNWSLLQSVPLIPHIHVVIKDASEDKISQIITTTASHDARL